MSKKMFALTTKQGTAMSETAYCNEHDSSRVGPFESDWDKGPVVDCTANDALSCQECGWIANP